MIVFQTLIEENKADFDETFGTPSYTITTLAVDRDGKLIERDRRELNGRPSDAIQAGILSAVMLRDLLRKQGD